MVNPFLTNVTILYPLKIPENQRFSGAFKGYKIVTLAKYWLIIFVNKKVSKCITVKYSIEKD